MSVRLTPRVLSGLRAVFGDCVPAENAAALVEDSPLVADADVKELAAAARFLAGKKLRTVDVDAAAPSAPASSARALHLENISARRDAKLERVLSPARLAEVMAQVNAMHDVPFAFLEEGCLMRSHVVAKRLEDAGVYSEKVFTIPSTGDLVMETKQAKLGFSVVWYHEAVVVNVRTERGVERRVLDPSVADRALTVEQWLSTMHGAEAGSTLETFFLPRFAHGLGDRDHPPSSWRQKDLDGAFAWLHEWRECQQALEESGFYATLESLKHGIT